jgi:hypothetical protein
VTIGLTGYFLLAGGGGGALGWGIASIGHVEPTSSAISNGVLYGISGAVILRAEFGSKPKRPAVDYHLKDARSLLTGAICWIGQSLNDSAEYWADCWLRNLSDAELVYAACRVREHVLNRSATRMSDKSKVAIIGPLVECMEKLIKDPDESERTDARARLESFCLKFYAKEYMAKPPTTPPSISLGGQKGVTLGT